MCSERTSGILRGGRLPLLLLLLLIAALALFMRTYDLQGTPPGIHYDEILNGEIAEQALQEGPHIYYARSGGREGLYHLFLAVSLATPLPVAWQMRLPSVLLSLLGLLFSYLWVARAFGRWAAITTTALMAVSFWTVLMSRVALRATTVTPVAALRAYLFVSMLCGASQSRRSRRLLMVGLGIVIGLSLYTYRAGSMIYVLYLLMALYLLVWRRSLARTMVLPLVVGFLVATPMLLLFVTQPEVDPRFGQVAVPWHALLDGDPVPVLRGAAAHLGMFFLRGDGESHYNFPGRPVFGPLSALLFAGGVLFALRRWKQPLYAFCLLWLGVGILPGVFTIPAPSFIHTVSAQGVVYVFPGIAIEALHRRVARPDNQGTERALFAAVAALILLNGVWTFIDFFRRWPALEEVRGFHQSELAAVAMDLETRAVSSTTAICSSVLNEDDSFWRSGRQSIRFMLNRSAANIRWYDCGFAQVIPVGQEAGSFYFLNNTSFGAWLSPPAVIRSEEVVAEDGARRVTVDLPQSRQALLGQMDDAPDAEEEKLFGEEMRFLGHHLEHQSVAAGSENVLLTFWEVLGPMPSERSVFVHVVGQEGQILTQGDGFSVLSDTLLPGDLVVQRHPFTIPGDAAAGEYPVMVGVYSRLGGQPPLPLQVNGEQREGRLQVATMTVEQP